MHYENELTYLSGNELFTSFFYDKTNEHNPSFAKNRFRKLAVLALRRIIGGIFYTSISYQISLCILIENFTAYLLV